MDKEKKVPDPTTNGPETGGSRGAGVSTRRGWIRSLLYGAAGLMGGGYVTTKTFDAQEGSIVTVETDAGVFNIVYSYHDIPNDPTIVQNTDALILEGEMHYSADERLVANIDERSQSMQYAPLFSAAAAQRRPMFFVDISAETAKNLDGIFSGDRQEARMSVAKLEALSGLLLVAYKMHAALRGKGTSAGEKPLSRREFFGAAAQETALPLAAYLATPLAESALTRTADERTVSRQTYRALHAVNTTMHPELPDSLLAEVRNALIAQKSESVARSLKSALGRRPTVTIVIGAAHIGLEDQLRAPEATRMHTVRSYMGAEKLRDERHILRLDPFLTRGEEIDFRFSFSEDPAFAP